MTIYHPGLFLLTISFILVHPSSQCDVSFYFKTNGNICDETNWKCEGTEVYEKSSCKLGKRVDVLKNWKGINGYSYSTSASPCDSCIELKQLINKYGN